MDIRSLALPAGIELDDGVDLGGSQRSSVTRHAVRSAPDSWGGSVVVKAFAGDDADSNFRRERAGLGYLAGTPELLASDEANTALVMADLGRRKTLADFLLGDDPERAWSACLQWAHALGEHVVADPAVVAQFRGELGSAEEQNQNESKAMPGRGLITLAEFAGTPVDDAAAEIDDAVQRGWDGPLVLSAGDTCPDNALFTGSGVQFLDCEGTSVHPVAIDAAYALEPFSSCWCVFSPPTGLTDAMLTEFTAGASAQLPGLGSDPHWPDAVRGAVVLWIVASSAWLLPGANAGTSSIGPAGALAPSARQLLLNRWRWLMREAAASFPATAQLADQALRRGQRQWPESTRLPGYPAWSS